MVKNGGRRPETESRGHAARDSSASVPPCILLLAYCFLFLLGAGNSFSQEITARASTDKTQYLVGDYIKYTINIDCDKGSKISAPDLIADSLKNVVLLHKEEPVEQEKSGRENVVYQYTLAGYDSAGVTIPQIAVRYHIPGDSTRRVVYANSVAFTIQKLSVNPQAEIKDVKPPEKILTELEIDCVLGPAWSICRGNPSLLLPAAS